ncbi:MAG: hypothetical protein AABX40_05630 [Candidatus Hydrothermarchaeota archaeon]
MDLKRVLKDDLVRESLSIFVVTRILIFVFGALGVLLFKNVNGEFNLLSPQLFLTVWANWDGGWYLPIVTEGYSGAYFSFFPLYPLMTGAVNYVIGNPVLSGMIVSNASFLISLIFLNKFITEEFGRSIASKAILYLSIFPTALFFNSVYSESTYLMFLILGFYYAKRGNWLYSGIFGFFCSLTRLAGVSLSIPVLYLYVKKRDRGSNFVSKDLLYISLIPLGLVTYLLYQYIATGNPLQFIDIYKNRGYLVSLPYVSIKNAVGLVLIGTKPVQTKVYLTLELLFTAFFFFMLILALKHLEFSYPLLMITQILFPLSSSSLEGMKRFILVIFPMYIILAKIGQNKNYDLIITLSSLGMLVLYTVLFVNWYWVT